MRQQIVPFLAGLVLALACAPARAQNPRISLTLIEVTGAEAMAALGRAAGVSIGIPDPEFGTARVVEERLREKASFRWESRTLAEALREFCARYRLRPARGRAGDYIVYPDTAPPAGPDRRVGLTEKDGVRIFMRRISISTARDTAFDPGPGVHDPGQMLLQFGGQLLEGAADTIAGLDNVSAMDDRGNLQRAWTLAGIGGNTSGASGGYPDEWSASVTFPTPHPRARKLLWVEGDLLVYQSVRALAIDVPLPVPPGGTRRVADGITVEITHFEPAREQQAPPGAGPRPHFTNPSIRARVVIPGEDLFSLHNNRPVLAVIGASGKLYDGSSGGTGSRGDGAGTLLTFNLTYGRIREPLVAARFLLVEKTNPKRRMSFRMADIPLPGDPSYVPQRASARPVLPPGAAAAEPERPFLEKGGGKLVSRVRLEEAAAPEGILTLGLAARSGNGWSETRWLDLPVGTDSATVLEDLRPGTYRLLRLYRTKGAPPPVGEGRWRNSEVVIEVAAGKESVAPPLVWAPLPEERAPAAKPTAAKAPPGRPPAAKAPDRTPAPPARPMPAPRRGPGR